MKRNIKILKNSLLTIVIIMLLLSFPEAKAATLNLDPSSGSYEVGDTFSVDMKVSSIDKAINAVSGIISFSRDRIEVTSVSKDKSILTLWPKEPSFSSNGCIVKFQGALLNPGFTGEDGKLVRINFRVKNTGVIRLNLFSSAVLANDGNGTDVLEKPPVFEFNSTSQNDDDADIFSDISGHWAQSKIITMNRACIIEGYQDEKFYPNKNMSRAQTSILLCRIMHDDSTANEKPFSDVDLDNWYGNCVASLKNSGIVSGYADGKFRPGASITRAEFLSIAMRAYEKFISPIETSPTQSPYADIKGSWYTDMVNSATELGFIEGSPCGAKKCFYPNKNILRSQAVSILFKMFERTF